MTRLESLLGEIADADLHRADPEGGWTCAQVVSHLHLSALLWVADLARLEQAGPRSFMYREELGHDVLGAPPHSAEEARGRVASARVALQTCLPLVSDATMGKELEVPPLGTYTLDVWMPGLIGHLAAHATQVEQILASRGLLPTAYR
jgi:hypothetical protein